LAERFGSGDGERKTLLTRQIAFEPLPASVLLGVSGRLLSDGCSMFVPESWSVMDVEMKVLGGLVISAVGGQSATAVLVGDAAAKLRCNGEHLVGDWKIARIESRERRDMALWDDDNMHGPIWLRVVKCENLLGLGDALDGDTP
jgi:hypothetical protein